MLQTLVTSLRRQLAAVSDFMRIGIFQTLSRHDFLTNRRNQTRRDRQQWLAQISSPRDARCTALGATVPIRTRARMPQALVTWLRHQFAAVSGFMRIGIFQTLSGSNYLMTRKTELCETGTSG